MLKGETITSVREFLQTNFPITKENRWAFTHYVIEYDGSNECKQDIARFIGGFCYGDLTVCNTALFQQRMAHEDPEAREKTRPLAQCVESILPGDWVCLSCGKFFVLPSHEIQDTLQAWNLVEVHYDVDRFKSYYGEQGKQLYAKSYWKEAAFI